MTTSLTRKLVDLLRRPVDAATTARAALHLTDWLGCAVAGLVEPAGKALAARTHAAPAGPASALGQGRPVALASAAFHNGGLGNILEMDDVHRAAILHPGPVVIPAALATAEARGASGSGLLEAIVRGYEADIRLGRSVGPGHYALWHNTATCGPIGSAAATGDLLGLEDDALVWALGNALTQSSGPWHCRHEPVMTKQLHTSRAAQAGMEAAELAAIGFTGPEFMLEGAQGFYAAMCPDPLIEALTAGPDGPWLMWETSFKPWPACRHAHAAIDAALLLRDRIEDAAAIEQIEVKTYSDAIAFCDRPDPQTTHEAKFSLQHSVAVTLSGGPPWLDAFDARSRDDPAVARLRQRTTVAAEDPFASAYPARYGAGITVKMADGRQIDAAVGDALGDPENPLSEDRIIAKALDLMAAGGVAPEPAQRVVAAAMALPDGAPLSDLSAALLALDTERPAFAERMPR